MIVFVTHISSPALCVNCMYRSLLTDNAEVSPAVSVEVRLEDTSVTLQRMAPADDDKQLIVDTDSQHSATLTNTQISDQQRADDGIDSGPSSVFCRSDFESRVVEIGDF